MSEPSWCLLTGEYPPQPGGVADYTALLAARLAESRPVAVVAPDSPGRSELPPNIHFFPLPDRFGPIALFALERHLARTPGPHRLLVQYVPHGFGMKALNLPLCLWLVWRRRGHGDDIRVMFHEVAYPFVRRPLKHNLIAVGNRLMAFVLMQACTRAYVSIPAWADLLRSLGGRRVAITWLPVQANVPSDPQPTAADIRAKFLGSAGTALVGHFGTYPDGITRVLGPAVARLLETRPNIRVLFLGRGSEKFRAWLVGTYPSVAAKVFATGGLDPIDVSAHIQACDVMIQPYPDGVSSRRGSMMACLANGVAVVTNLGPLSEPLWEGELASGVADPPIPDRFSEVAMHLLGSPELRCDLGARGRELYQVRFAFDRTVEALLAE